jgi:hypothetical protein
LSFGPDGLLYVVADGTDATSTQARVLRFRAATGAFVDTFFNAGASTNVVDVVVHQSNDIYATLGNNMVAHYTGGFSHIPTVPYLATPRNLTLAVDDNLYVSAQTADAVTRFRRDNGSMVATPGFVVRDVKKNGGSIANLVDTDNLLDKLPGAAEILSETTAHHQVVGFADPQANSGTARFGVYNPFPNDSTDDDNDFAVRASALIEIPGPWAIRLPAVWRLMHRSPPVAVSSIQPQSCSRDLLRLTAAEETMRSWPAAISITTLRT